MSDAWIDTDVIIRLLTGDDSDKQRSARVILEQVERGSLTVHAPHTVVADAVYVLHSKKLYNQPKAEVAELLLPLVQLPHFRLQNRRAVVIALQLYSSIAGLDFTDALLIALMMRQGPPIVYSWDTDYDDVPGVTRVEP
jgi:uncharacterized protein